MTDSGEHWRPVIGLNYEVSNIGRVRSLATGTVLRSKRSSGYPAVTLSRNGWTRQFRTHELVAAAFLGARPTGYLINHKNGDKADARVENLEYVTVTRNIQHAYETGLMPRGEQRRHAKLAGDDIPAIRRLAAEGVTQRKIATQFGVLPATVNDVLRGRSWKHVP